MSDARLSIATATLGVGHPTIIFWYGPVEMMPRLAQCGECQYRVAEVVETVHLDDAWVAQEGEPMIAVPVSLLADAAALLHGYTRRSAGAGTSTGMRSRRSSRRSSASSTPSAPDPALPLLPCCQSEGRHPGVSWLRDYRAVPRDAAASAVLSPARVGLVPPTRCRVGSGSAARASGSSRTTRRTPPTSGR